MLLYLGNFIIVLSMCCLLSSCHNDVSQINALTSVYDVSKDVGENVKIIYSDSGKVKLIIEAAVIERYNDYTEAKDEFPKGILITFIDENKKPMSWLKADQATRLPKLKKMIAKGNVSFYNAANDKLQSSELIWDEGTKTIYTNKFIKISQPSKGDTIYGMGFVTDQELKRMEIKTRVKAKINSASLNLD